MDRAFRNATIYRLAKRLFGRAADSVFDAVERLLDRKMTEKELTELSLAFAQPLV
jgi:hypothetical protein